MMFTEKANVHQARKWLFRNQWDTWFLLILVISFWFFLSNLSQYGASYDEPLLYEYADRTVDVYAKMITGDQYDNLLDFYNLPYYGSAYLTLGQLIVNGITYFFPNLDLFDSWHIVNFSTFLLSSWIIYLLASSIISKPTAFFTAVLFLTQPLIWGHGVMNPKDIPFMTAFLAAVFSGLEMVKHSPTTLRTIIRESRTPAIHKPKRFYILAGLITLLFILIDRILNNIFTKPIMTDFVDALFSNSSGMFFQKIRLILVNSAILLPTEYYLSKALRIVNMIEFLILAGVLIAGLFLFMKKSTPFWKWMLIAGFFSGLAAGIRVLGPATTLLVILFYLLSRPRKPQVGLFIYILLVLIFAYASWPYLWSQPIARFYESIHVMVNFPWNGQVRFEGADLSPNNLPWYYLPKLIGIQLTLPVIFLSLIGTGVMIRRIFYKKDHWQVGLVLLIWFWIPLLLVMIFQPTMYDNFRQFLFIIPPLFLLAGISWDLIKKKIPHTTIWKYVSVGLLFPGVIAGVWLHPYEYIYYNVFVGWTASIERRYESDYWATSMCEAGSYLSEKSHNPELIVISDQIQSQLFNRCATHPFDIRIEREEYSLINPKFAVINSRYNDDLDYFRDYPIILSIKRGRTIFTVIKAFQE